MNYGRYQILREIGRGSMGVVYQALDPQIDRLVAVKVLRHDRVATDTFVSRFLKEAKVIGRLSHPNIVTIYDVGNEEGNIYIAMEFLEGMPLSDLIRERHPAPDEVMETGIQIAEILDYAHEKGVVHRDIKPSNIIVSPDRRIKITDFGIARMEDSTATLQTQAGEILGTPAYMSPEQIMGQTVDRRADIFSLGVILYEMVTGSRPFGGEGKTIASIFNDIIRITPPEPHIISSIVPKKLSDIIMKALQKEPGKRFQTCRELAEALRECKYKIEPAAEVKLPATVKNKKYVLPVAVIISGIILAAGTYFLYQYLNGPQMRQAVKKKKMLPAEVMPAISASGPKQDTTNAGPGPEYAAKQKLADVPSGRKVIPSLPPAAYEQIQPQSSGGLETKKRVPVPAKQKPLSILAPLTLRSSPDGAGVYIDDSFKGRTPMTLMVSTGEHRIKLILSGYRDAEKRITMEETMEYPLTFNLKAVKEAE